MGTIPDNTNDTTTSNSEPSVEAPNADATQTVEIDDPEALSSAVLSGIVTPLADSFAAFLALLSTTTPEYKRAIHRYFIELGQEIKTLPWDANDTSLHDKLKRYGAMDILFGSNLLSYSEIYGEAANEPGGESAKGMHAFVVRTADQNKAAYEDKSLHNYDGSKDDQDPLAALVGLLQGMGATKQ